MVVNLSRNDVIVASISLLFLFGLFVPSSWNYKMFYIPAFIAPFVILVIFTVILSVYKKVSVRFLIPVFFINLIIWGATLFSPGERIRNVAGLTYILISLMFLIDFKSLKINKYFSYVFKFSNIIVILIGFGMVMYNQGVYNFFVNYYSDFYVELVPNMLDRGKPVITFGTHSLAAFYLFVFFYLNIKTYSIENKKVYLFTSLVYLYFCYQLSSNSGYVFLLFGLVILAFHMKRKLLTTLIITIAIISIAISNPYKVQEVTDNIKYSFSIATSSNINGLASRYTESGNQSININYILENPLNPTGLSASANSGLSYHDSGLIATTLEGTIVLTLLLYGTLFYFIKRNTLNIKSAFVLFLALIVMQLGYNNLFYFRLLGILPFVLIYVNYLEHEKVLTIN